MSNTSYNTSSSTVSFPNAYIGTVVKVDSVNSNVIIKSKNVDIGSTNGTDKIMNVNNEITVVGDTTTDNTMIDLKSLLQVKQRLTTVAGITTTTDNIRLKSNDVKIGKHGVNNDPVIEIVNNNPALEAYSASTLPSTNVDSTTQLSSIVDITLANILALQ